MNTYGYKTSLPDFAKVKRRQFGAKNPIPTQTLPKWLVWIIGPFLNEGTTRKFIDRNIGYPFLADNSKGKEELGLTYRPLETSLTEMFQQLIDNQLV